AGLLPARPARAGRDGGRRGSVAVTDLGGMSKPVRSERPRWPPSVGLIGLLVALIATFVVTGIAATIYALSGYDHPSDAPSFDFVALALQSAAFVGAALLMTERLGRP